MVKESVNTKKIYIFDMFPAPIRTLCKPRKRAALPSLGLSSVNGKCSRVGSVHFLCSIACIRFENGRCRVGKKKITHHSLLDKSHK